jgi:hypothetical protein
MLVGCVAMRTVVLAFRKLLVLHAGMDIVMYVKVCTLPHARRLAWQQGESLFISCYCATPLCIKCSSTGFEYAGVI